MCSMSVSILSSRPHALRIRVLNTATRGLEYVKDLRRRAVPSTITLQAIRDLQGAERQAGLAICGRPSQRHG
jgi:hypothetical protein